MEEMKEAYLKCKYYKREGMLFSNEYGIKFKTFKEGEQNWCIIDESELRREIDGEDGFVSVVVCHSSKTGEMLVAINDVAEHRISVFSVPETEILYKISQ